MNDIEFSLQSAKLSSYPTYLSMNLIARCNARCRFCFYSEDYIPKGRITLADIKKMEWLKYVSTIDLYGGLGEPLLHPEFSDIVEYLYEQNPDRTLIFTTNGQLLTKEVSDRISGKIKNVTVSINAARKETYEFLMTGCSWERLMENLEYFQSVRRTKSKLTTLSFSYVANKYNIEELPELITFAKHFTAGVGVNHFSTAGVWYPRKEPRLNRTDTLYFHKDLYDNFISKARAAFENSGIFFASPPLFSDEEETYLGTRVKKGAIQDRFTCRAPWSTAYINPHPQGRWVSSCCSIGASHTDMTLFSPENDFMKI